MGTWPGGADAVGGAPGAIAGVGEVQAAAAASSGEGSGGRVGPDPFRSFSSLCAAPGTLKRRILPSSLPSQFFDGRQAVV